MMIDFKYLFNKYNIQPKGILHCGASVCQEAEMYDQLNIPKVIWVEAIPEIFEDAKINLSKYPNQSIINACIGDVDGKEVVFNVSNNEAQSSSYLDLGLHKIIHPTVHYLYQLPMVTKRIDTLNKELNLGIEEIDFINFDLQGVELEALKSMGELIKNIKYAYLEVNRQPTYTGGALVWQIDEFLFKYGFDRKETSQWVGDSWGDALYCKR